jgi:hypothetical protein
VARHDLPEVDEREPPIVVDHGVVERERATQHFP